MALWSAFGTASPFRTAVRGRFRRLVAAAAVWRRASLSPAPNRAGSAMPVNFRRLAAPSPVGRISRVPRCSIVNANAVFFLSMR